MTSRSEKEKSAPIDNGIIKMISWNDNQFTNQVTKQVYAKKEVHDFVLEETEFAVALCYADKEPGHSARTRNHYIELSVNNSFVHFNLKNAKELVKSIEWLINEIHI